MPKKPKRNAIRTSVSICGCSFTTDEKFSKIWLRKNETKLKCQKFSALIPPQFKPDFIHLLSLFYYLLVPLSVPFIQSHFQLTSSPSIDQIAFTPLTFDLLYSIPSIFPIGIVLILLLTISIPFQSSTAVAAAADIFPSFILIAHTHILSTLLSSHSYSHCI